MLAEFAHLLFICAFIIALLSVVVLSRYQSEAAQWGSAVKLYSVCVWLSFLGLLACFYDNDFSVRIVAQHTSELLPWYYRLPAMWSGHEGSMFLWLGLLTLWMRLSVSYNPCADAKERSTFYQILLLLCLGLHAYILFVSNPFLRDFSQYHGRDLNPLLQDPGLLFHPPILYSGYVGFVIVFAQANALLWHQRSITSLQAARPWTLFAWAALTLGIISGSWWAYRELGWGGWWFWDPVENASLLPWLAATALLHQLLLVQKQQASASLTFFLAQLTFILSLLGTFLVRSGVLISVHSFANDPSRGVAMLLLLTVISLASFSLLAYRSQSLARVQLERVLSKPMLLLFAALILLTLLFCVALGTLYPLLISAIGGQLLSIGAPYFNSMCQLLLLPMILPMLCANSWSWAGAQRNSWRAIVLFLVVAATISALLLYVLSPRPEVMAWYCLSLALALALSTLYYALSTGLCRSMALGHLGFAILVIGVTMSSTLQTEILLTLKPGESVTANGYQITLQKIQRQAQTNFTALQAQLEIKHKQQRYRLNPERRLYTVSGMWMTDADIHSSAWQDIYASLGRQSETGQWLIRVYIKPMVRWIWLGGLIMILASFLAWPRQRHAHRRVQTCPV